MIANLFGLENRTLIVSGVDVRQDSALNALFGNASSTVAKVNVSVESAQAFSAVYACVRLIATTIGHLPFNVYERTNENGDRQVARDHALYDMLRLRPNPEMTAIFMRQSAMASVLLWGRSYSYIESDGSGNIIGLWPMRTNDVKRIRVNGSTYYDVSKVDDNELYPKPPFSKKTLSRNNVIELTTFDGQSIITHAREQIGEAIAAQQFGAGFYAGGAQPYLYLKHPGVLSDPEKLRNNWNAIHSGKERKVALLEEGMDVGTIGMPLGDAQFLESREFYITDIARWFGVPPHKIGDLKRATFSNIEEQNLEWRENLLPWLEMCEQEYETKMFTERDRKRFFVEHNTDELLRGNTITRYKAHASALQWGWKSRNEVRHMENLNSVEGGDTYLVPANMITAEEMDADDKPDPLPPMIPPAVPPAVEPEDEEDKSDALKKAARSAVSAALQRLMERETTEVRKASIEKKNFIEWVDDFYRKWPEKMLVALRPADAVSRALLGDVIDESAIRKHCERSKAKLLTIAGSATSSELVAEVEKQFIINEPEVLTQKE